MNHSRFYVIALSFILLCCVIGTASAVSVTIGPDQIEEGDTITIDISDLEDGRTLTFRMESVLDLRGGSRFSYQTNKVYVPFRLEDMEVTMVVQPVTEAGYEVQLGDFIFSESKKPPASSDTVTVRQNIGDRGPGTIDYLKAFGAAVPGSHDVDLLLQLMGTKKGVDSGSITFELEGIQDGYVRITIEVDGSVVESTLITIGSPEPIDTRPQFGQAGDIPFIDGENKGVFRPAGGYWIFADEDWNPVIPSGEPRPQFGMSGDIPVTDGGDKGVFRPSTGEWIFADSDWNPVIPSGEPRPQFGMSGDIPVIDGGDKGVFRPAGGYWIFADEDWNPTPFAERPQFGQVGDFPILYDDMSGVFRPATGEWIFADPDWNPVIPQQ